MSKKNTPSSALPLRVLVVSYYYPPQNYISALRLGKLTKYLAAYDFEPWVLTLREGLLSSAGALPVEIPENQVIRADLGPYLTKLTQKKNSSHQLPAEASACSEYLIKDSLMQKPHLPYLQFFLHKIWRLISNQFCDVRFPDRALPWVFPAIQRGSALLRQRHFDVILSSHGPPSSHIVAAVLARRFRIPWVADYRDLWSQNHIQRRHGSIQRFEERLEQWILRPAAQITTVSGPLGQQLEALHSKPVTVIQNGFDEDDFSFNERSKHSCKFKIIYTGMIYPGKRDPSLLFEAINILHNRRPDIANNVELHFFGADPQLITDLANERNVSAHLRLHSRIANEDALRWQQQADLLLLLEWNDHTAKGVYTGKIFEYLGARRPILATGFPGGVIDALLRETDSGILVTNAIDAASMIESLWHRKQREGSTRITVSEEKLQKYTRRYQAGILARVLRSAIRSSAENP